MTKVDMEPQPTPDDPLKPLQRTINCLSDSNRMKRRKALESIQSEVLDCSPQSSLDQLSTIFQEVHRPMLKLFSDGVDRNRETATRVVHKFCVQLGSACLPFLSHIIPIVRQRLTSDLVDDLEPTEELRLLHLECLSSYVDLVSGSIGDYVDDYVAILQRTINDSFAEVVKMSCECVRKFAATCPQKFYMQGESLIQSLLKALSHHHNKVRKTVLETIGLTVKATSGKTVDDVFPHLAQRTFDHSPPVRLMVTNVVGDWLVNLTDRYSFFHKLLPLLMSGFCDEMKDIQEKSFFYFKLAGKQYEDENEKDFKEKKEYTVLKHFEYMITYERPSIGCRALIQRNISKILPAIANDITDWNAETKIKSAHLLYHLIFHAEDHMTMNIELAMQSLYRAACDDDKQVAEQVLRSAELIGLFVEPSVHLSLALTNLKLVATGSSGQLSSSLAVMSALVRGANPKLCEDDKMASLTSLVSSTDICHTVDPSLQAQLIACVRSFAEKDGINLSPLALDLFRILLCVTSMSSTERVRHEISQLFTTLSTGLGYSDKSELFRVHGPVVLQNLQASVNSWVSSSLECHIFAALLSLAGPSLAQLLSHTIPIFVECCKTDRDPELRLRMFSLMSGVVMNELHDSVKSAFQSHTFDFVKKCVLVNCVWQAGRVLAAVRSAAISFLWALLQAGILTDDHLSDCLNEMQQQIVSCLDDHNVSTRMVTVKVFIKLLTVCKDAIDVDHLHAMYTELIKRMDDSEDEIRLLTTKSMRAFFRALPQSYERDLYRGHLEFIYKTMLVHMDDPEQQIQDAVLDCLKVGARLYPGLLKSMTIEAKTRHRCERYCDMLISHCTEEMKDS